MHHLCTCDIHDLTKTKRWDSYIWTVYSIVRWSNSETVCAEMAISFTSNILKAFATSTKAHLVTKLHIDACYSASRNKSLFM